MAAGYELRGRLVAFDNISVGNPTGRERTMSGVTPSTELVGGGSGSSTMGAGADAKHYSNVVSAAPFNACDPSENYISGEATPHAERLG